MKVSGAMMPMIDSVISETPGFIIGLSWRTSLVARAMMSPTRWRLWKVWLLPNRLMYSSSRASRSRRWPSVSTDQELVISSRPRTSTRPRIVRAMVSRRAGLGAGRSTSSKASPVSRGMVEKNTLVSAAASRKLASRCG